MDLVHIQGVLPYQLVLVCDNKIVPSLQLTNGVVITKRYCQRIEIYKSSVKIYVPMLFEENNYEIFNFIKNIFYRNLKINDSENWTGLIKASYKGYISFDYYPCFDLGDSLSIDGKKIEPTCTWENYHKENTSKITFKYEKDKYGFKSIDGVLISNIIFLPDFRKSEIVYPNQ